MSKVSNALKKKWGPMPAWVWLLSGGLIYYFYRKYSATAASGTGTGSVAPAPVTPQSPVTLSPGESVYDPNTGTLTNTPLASNPAAVGDLGSGAGGVTSASDPLAQSLDDLANAIANMTPPDQTAVNDTTPSPVAAPAGVPAGKIQTPAQVFRRTGARQTARAGSSILGKGAFTALTGGKRGKNRTPKSKGQHNAQAKTSKPVKPGRTTRGRSTTALRSAPAGGRTAPRQPSPTTTRHATTVHRTVSTPQQPSRARQRPRQPAAQQVVTQRRPATLPRQSPSRQEGGIAPRPSAPPPRTQRAPAPPPPPRPVPRRPPPRHR